MLELQSELRARMEAEPVRFLQRDLEALLDASRGRLARLLGTAAENLAFVTNATTGVNAVVRSLDFKPGDEILTTNHDYNACRCALADVAQRRGARLVVARVPFPLSGDDDVIAAVMAAVTPRTRLAMIDHVTSPTALVFPVERLVRELEARGVDVLVDGAHAPGMLPVNLDQLQPAYYTGNCHKWLCSPKGAGFLYVRPDRQERIQPAVISHGYNTPRPGRNALHTRFDWVGTLDPTPWLCVGAAIDWCDALMPGGLGELMRHNRELACAARRLCCTVLNVSQPCPDGMLGAMATFELPARFQGLPTPPGANDPLQTRLLERHAVEVPVVNWGEPSRRYVRISAQAHNS
ncbi:MAG: aminotransferase class V-fold PLP-dependent enzyme, partial [Kiritimatiellaeota bacterium]|nr:aminotransferase class V-fold PLP-dependent enzyme [Kiritimatiellota bacterium]